MKVLASLSNSITPIIRDNRIIDFRIKLGNEVNLYFRDSCLMLPASLKDLAKKFGVEEKGTFPYLFVNESYVSLD
jgi:hypothetical protein